jgi:hypothetical protein
MQRAVTIAIRISCFTCGAGVARSDSAEAFVQDDVKIVPPIVRFGYDRTTGLQEVKVYNDGGT